ncbi:M16 family metallopeptidase [Burkholderia stagnalis]|uniref:M16 family metallopeptidase n=1 Tax=Burkholderia stagnalis TaxID=1503054 RepID=UPI000756DFB1|nr:insulinase family protein [Burkholderia stagnalis]KVM81854.1 hypothetical protein WT05_21865 [Burkholderia stagnalis]
MQNVLSLDAKRHPVVPPGRGVRSVVNDVSLIWEAAPGLHAISMGVGIGRGAYDDPHGEAGLAHFCEHARVAQVNRMIGPAKARVLSVEAFTERNETYFVVCALKQDAAVLGEWLDAFLNPRPLDDAAIEQERAVLVEEVATLESSEISRIDDEFLKAAYGDERMWRPIGGRVADVAALAGANVHRAIADDNRRGKIAVALVGDLQPTGLLASVERTLGVLPRARETVAAAAADPMPTHGLAAGRAPIPTSLGVGYFMLGYPAFPRFDERRVSLYAMSLIFGEDEHSVLYNALRVDKALLYAVNSECHLFKDHGHLIIRGMVAYDKLERVMDHVFELAAAMPAIVQDRVVQDEARQALMRTLLMRLDDPRNRLMRLLKHEMWFDAYFDYEDDLDFIRGVTPQSLHEVTEAVLRSPPLICHGVANG